MKNTITLALSLLFVHLALAQNTVPSETDTRLYDIINAISEDSIKADVTQLVALAPAILLAIP